MRRYQAVECKKEKSLSDLSSRLSVDLRRAIRQLDNCEILSSEWCGMAMAINRIGNATAMEAKLPKSSASETLWEGNEQALRYILEDGKLGVCLKLMVDLKAYQWRRETTETATPGVGISKEKADDVMLTFEQGMGSLLHCACEHPEAIRTIDAMLLVNHIADVLEHALKNGSSTQLADLSSLGHLDSCQEVQCLSYLEGVALQAQHTEDEEALRYIRNRGIAVLCARFLLQHKEILSNYALETGASALSAICCTEHFRTYRAEHVPEHDRELFVQLKEGPLADICERNPSARRKIRALLDFSMQCARGIGRK